MFVFGHYKLSHSPFLRKCDFKRAVEHRLFGNMSRIVITNIAMSWKMTIDPRCTRQSFEELCFKNDAENEFVIKYHSNFAVLRSINTQFVFIVFYGGHVNCTGISHPSLVLAAMRLFKSVFHAKIFSVKVQAIAATSAGKSFEPQDVQSIKARIPVGDSVRVIKHFFSGLLIRFKGGGSAQLFYSGRINFLGGKSVSHITCMHREVTLYTK